MNKGNYLLIVFKLIFAVRESPQIIAENDINIQRNAFNRDWNWKRKVIWGFLGWTVTVRYCHQHRTLELHNIIRCCQIYAVPQQMPWKIQPSTIKHNTIQYIIRQDKTRQDNTRKDNTRQHNWTTQENRSKQRNKWERKINCFLD